MNIIFILLIMIMCRYLLTYYLTLLTSFSRFTSNEYKTIFPISINRYLSRIIYFNYISFRKEEKDKETIK